MLIKTRTAQFTDLLQSILSMQKKDDLQYPLVIDVRFYCKLERNLLVQHDGGAGEAMDLSAADALYGKLDLLHNQHPYVVWGGCTELQCFIRGCTEISQDSRSFLQHLGEHNACETLDCPHPSCSFSLQLGHNLPAIKSHLYTCHPCLNICHTCHVYVPSPTYWNSKKCPQLRSCIVGRHPVRPIQFCPPIYVSRMATQAGETAVDGEISLEQLQMKEKATWTVTATIFKMRSSYQSYRQMKLLLGSN